MARSVALAAVSLLFCATSCQPPDGTLPGRPNSPPTVEIEAPEGYVGFGQEVRIEATVSDADNDDVEVQWAQVAGEPLELTGRDRPALSFRTHTLDVLAPPEDGPARVLALRPRQAGHYRFELTASAGEHTTKVRVDVRAAPATPGWPRAAQEVETILDAGRVQESYDWALHFGPPRAEPVLQKTDSRRATIRFTKPGRYIVRERVSGRDVSIHAGPWMGTEQCGRIECHPVEADGWATTKMATVLARGLDGKLRSDYNRDCIRCHTIGFDESMENEGFDDVARKVGWTFPRRLQPGNFAALPPLLADRANVGCEACHGPGRFYTSYSADVCAQCHDSPPDYENPAEWRRAPMAQIRDGVTEQPECRRCHTAQGFIDEYFGHRPAQETARVEDVQYELEPITCGVCHDTHNGARERLVRYGGPVWGQDPDVDWGTGMICLACHHGGSQWGHPRGALMRPFVPRVHSPPEKQDVNLRDQRWAPHAPQGDLVRGRAGHALPGPGPLEASPPHLGVPGGCVGCHVRTRPPEDDPRRGLVGGHTFAMFSGEGVSRVENTEVCAPCHGELESLSRPVRHDYDGNGRREGIYEEVANLLEMTRVAVDSAITGADFRDGDRQATSFGEHDGRLVLADAEGNFLGDPEEPMTFPDDEDRLYRAVYNYVLIVKDRSNGVHNPVWTVRLLQRTILRLTPQNVPRWYWR